MQGECAGLLYFVRAERGTERQVGHRRRWREGRCEGEGGLSVQFCSLHQVISYSSEICLTGEAELTRQTTLPQRLQSLTKSLAQVLIFPETRWPASPSMCHLCPLCFWGRRFMDSFSQRNVWRTRRLRYCRRVKRIWRQVCESACRVFRSMWWVNSVIILVGGEGGLAGC